MRLTVGDHSAGHLRRILRHYLDAWSLPDLAPAAELALTELLANVVRHVPDRLCALWFRRHGEGVRVEVTDGSPELPQVRAAGPLDEGGRGLRLVEAVTDRWGVEPCGFGEQAYWGLGEEGKPGKTVWFECVREGGAGTVSGTGTLRVVDAWQ
ncbi:ATP-binding protein [Streptomyces sp. NA04227]|nr:ATP-binding protein [Streptomyces sp. NA04227]